MALLEVIALAKNQGDQKFVHDVSPSGEPVRRCDRQGRGLLGLKSGERASASPLKARLKSEIGGAIKAGIHRGVAAVSGLPQTDFAMTPVQESPWSRPHKPGRRKPQQRVPA